MWVKKIKQKKMQFILISIILMVSSFIFAICASFTSTVSSYTQEYYNGENIKDIVVQTYSDETVSKIDSYIKKYETNENDARRTKGVNVDRLTFLNNENLDLGMSNLIVYEGKEYHPWEVLITEGANNKVPSKGSIWISNILADVRDISVGDTIKVKVNNNYEYLTVEALVNDSMSPSTVSCYYNIFINKQDYHLFNGLMESTYIGYDSSKEGSEATSALNNYLDGEINGSIYDVWITEYAASATSSITGAVGLIAAVLIFVVSIIIMRFVLWNNILKEYKSIGVYKALGFSSKQIRNIYLKSFGIVGISAIIIGSFISIFYTNYLVKLSVMYIGNFENYTTDFTFIVVTILVMSLILILNLYLLLRKINDVNPVEALRVGITSSKKKFKKSIIKDASSPMEMAINDIFKYRKQNIVILIVLTLVIYLSLFFVSINYSFINMKYNAWNMFGIIQGDVTLDFPSNTDGYNNALEDIKNDSRVKGYRENSIDMGMVLSIDTTKYNIQSAMIIPFICSSYDNSEDFKVSIVDGRNPRSKDEIAISHQILKDSGLSIGDYIDVKVFGKERRLLITGEYVGMMANNYNVRVTTDIVEDVPVNALPNLNLAVTLNNKEDYEAFKSDYKDKYEECSIDACPSLVNTATLSVIDIIKPVTGVMVSGIVIFSILNIINLIIINNTDNRRNYGVMKSLGFSSNYMIKRTLYRILIITGISSLIGFTLNVAFSVKLFSICMNGISGLMIDYGQLLITIAAIVILTIVATIVTMLSIRKVSTVELMEE